MAIYILWVLLSHLKMGLMTASLPLAFCGMKILPPVERRLMPLPGLWVECAMAVPTYLWDVDKMEFAF